MESPGSIDDLINQNNEADLVTTSLSFLMIHLKIDGTDWAPFLSSVFIGSMALLQVTEIIRQMIETVTGI